MLLSRIRRSIEKLIKRDDGVSSVILAAALPLMAGFVATAVDLGMVYVARNELQNAADAAALAGATVMLTSNEEYQVVMQVDEGLASATQYANANSALGVDLQVLDDDMVLGFWDVENGAFTSTSPSQPSDLNACEVTLRRDDTANTPVSSIFSRILGRDFFNVAVTSIAFRGYAGSVPAGTVDLPIAVHQGAISGGSGPDCGTTLTFASENSENAEWTTFFTWPSNDNKVRDYVDGSEDIPELEVGDTINVTNGKLSQQTFAALVDRFNNSGVDTNGDGIKDYWRVVLPVVDPGSSEVFSTVTGFCTFIITEVRPAPDKDLTGHLQCDMLVPGSETGGEDYGSRAAFAKLIR